MYKQHFFALLCVVLSLPINCGRKNDNAEGFTQRSLKQGRQLDKNIDYSKHRITAASRLLQELINQNNNNRKTVPTISAPLSLFDHKVDKNKVDKNSILNLSKK